MLSDLGFCKAKTLRFCAGVGKPNWAKHRKLCLFGRFLAVLLPVYRRFQLSSLSKIFASYNMSEKV